MKALKEQKTNIVARMADRMLELGLNGVPVTPEALHEHSDFTHAEIKSYGPEASDVARQTLRSVRS